MLYIIICRNAVRMVVVAFRLSRSTPINNDRDPLGCMPPSGALALSPTGMAGAVLDYT